MVYNKIYFFYTRHSKSTTSNTNTIQDGTLWSYFNLRKNLYNDAVVKNTNTQTKSGDASENFQKSITENTNLNKILDGRLNRLEHSILRQEKISIDILMALNKILSKNI